ncbi:MAG TPA: hypothetical protein VGJ37_07095 [Pyrinomonadaceae bacterium]|jgi:hypothetical protein
MAVVINEFEVAPAEPETKRKAEASPENAGGGGGEKPQEQDIEKMLAHHSVRCERVWAH